FLAGRGADAAGEFREVVGGVEVARSLLPVAVVDEVIPVRDLVVDRAARIAVAERDTAIHAAGGLIGNARFRERNGELVEVTNAVRRRLVARFFAFDFEKASALTHCLSPYSAATLTPEARFFSISRMARRYSTGMTLT